MKHLVAVGAPRFPYRKLSKDEFEITFVVQKEDLRKEDANFCSRVLAIDCMNEKELSSILLGLNKLSRIDAIVCFSEHEEIAVYNAAKELGLKTSSIEAIKMTRNKRLMRDKLVEKGLRSVNYMCGRGTELLDAFIENYGFPLIIKPVDDTGSRNIFSAESIKDYDQACAMLTKNKREFIIEEYIFGHEISVEAFTINGKHKILTITDKITTGAPYFIELGHTLPSLIDEKKREEVNKMTKEFLTIINHTHGPSHTEMKITREGPVIIESHVRPGGDCIVDLMEIAFGYDVYRETIDYFMGCKSTYDFWSNKKGKGSAGIRYIESPSGAITEVEGFNEIEQKEGWFRTFNPYIIGEFLPQMKDSFSRKGWVMVSGNTSKDTINNSKKILETIKITVDETIKESGGQS
ncbi:MAG: ATP-grasp domain-containing protein [Candidatus Izemoplasmataceae bacterium]